MGRRGEMGRMPLQRVIRENLYNKEGPGWALSIDALR